CATGQAADDASGSPAIDQALREVGREGPCPDSLPHPAGTVRVARNLDPQHVVGAADTDRAGDAQASAGWVAPVHVLPLGVHRTVAVAGGVHDEAASRYAEAGEFRGDLGRVRAADVDRVE